MIDKNACPDTNIKLFDDDANFFVEGDSEFELTDKVKKVLEKISLWCTANQLSLRVKYLGLLIDEKLKNTSCTIR